MVEFEMIIVLGFAIVISISGIVINLIKRGSAATTSKYSIDKTLVLFRVLVPLALIASILVYLSELGSFTTSYIFFYTSVFLIISGLFLRIYTVNYLGKYFTVNIQLLAKQVLITKGPFQYIRHPSYTGLLLYYFGLGLLMHNLISLVILIICPVIVVLIRIRQEEKMMIAQFREQYEAYQARTKMLFPLIF